MTSTCALVGLSEAARLALAHRRLPLRSSTPALQRSGKVGADAAGYLAEAGLTVRAVSDRLGAVYKADGLDIDALRAHHAQTGSVVGFTGAEPLDPGALLTLDVTLLVPAAVESVLTKENAHLVRAQVIVEGANGPTTTEADDVLVVPDILANAGGVIVSYVEWVQANQAYWWTQAEVEERLRPRMEAAWRDVLENSAQYSLTLRQAATVLAVERVAEAHLHRGLYP